MQKEKHTTLKIIIAGTLFLIGFNYYLNNYYTFTRKPETTEHVTAVTMSSDSPSESKIFRTGIMYYMEKALNENGYDFNWDDVITESEVLLYE